MKTYTVTEVEQKDWDELELMTKKEAIEILDNDTTVRGFIGGYSYGSTDDYDYRKAQIYRAIGVLIGIAIRSEQE